MSSLLNRLEQIKAKLSLHIPFIAAVGMTLKFQLEKCGTAMTNGTWVKFDPEWCESLTAPELAYLVAHEIGHKALCHPWRRGNRNPAVWNMACDHVLNNWLNLLRNPMFSMPKVGLADRRFHGKSEEEVYNILIAEAVPVPAGYKVDLVDNTSRPLADAEVEILNIAKGCQMAGAGNGLTDFILNNPTHTETPWQDIVREFAVANIRGGSTWSRRSRRHSHAYIPANLTHTLQELVAFADVSGSMVVHLQHIVNELNQIMFDVGPETVHAVCGDDRVSSVRSFSRGEEIELEVKGGGGTDFRPLFREVEDRGWEPNCGIFLTDTYGTFPDVPPAYPVLWAVIGSGRQRISVPWGSMVKIRV